MVPRTTSARARGKIRSMTGTWRVRERGGTVTLAHVKVEERDGGLYVYWRPAGAGDWEENFDAYGLLLGDAGAVERLPDGALAEA